MVGQVSQFGPTLYNFRLGQVSQFGPTLYNFRVGGPEAIAEKPELADRLEEKMGASDRMLLAMVRRGRVGTHQC